MVHLKKYRHQKADQVHSTEQLKEVKEQIMNEAMKEKQGLPRQNG